MRCDDRPRGIVAEAEEGGGGQARQGWEPKRERNIVTQIVVDHHRVCVCVCMRLDGSTWAECKRANAFATCTFSPANAFRWHVCVCVCTMTVDKCRHV